MKRTSADVGDGSNGVGRNGHALVGGIMWLVVAAGNAFVLFLWIVFGLAAAAGADTDSFTRWTAIGTISPLLVSFYLLSRARYVLATLCLFLVMPTVFACVYVFG